MNSHKGLFNFGSLNVFVCSFCILISTWFVWKDFFKYHGYKCKDPNIVIHGILLQVILSLDIWNICTQNTVQNVNEHSERLKNKI